MAQEIADSSLLDTWGSSGNIVEPDISKIIEGWQLGEQPPHEYMNWLQNTFGSKLNHILKNGVAKWNDETPYLAGSSVQHNGYVWLCKITNTNSEPADANANWERIITKDYVDNKPTLSIGTILNGYTIFDNCIVAFGGEFNRADYPKLWAYLQANPTLVKTQAQWQTETTANGGICGFFSDGNGTTTFRVPNLDKAFLRPDSRGAGSYQGDAIREMTGSFSTDNGWGFTGASGVFNMPTPSIISKFVTAAGVTLTSPYFSFKASNQVPTANENRPKNIASLPLIVAK